MDAAALYMAMTLPSGEQKTSTKEFSNLPTCEVQADRLRRRMPSHPKPPDTVEYRCEAHLPIFLLANHQRGRSRHLLNFTSLQGCPAYRWLVHIRDRRSTAYCYDWARITNAANREGEEDGMDMFGQPGLKRLPR
jgi:hypothetical protein